MVLMLLEGTNPFGIRFITNSQMFWGDLKLILMVYNYFTIVELTKHITIALDLQIFNTNQSTGLLGTSLL